MKQVPRALFALLMMLHLLLHPAAHAFAAVPAGEPALQTTATQDGQHADTVRIEALCFCCRDSHHLMAVAVAGYLPHPPLSSEAVFIPRTLALESDFRWPSLGRAPPLG